MTLVKRVALVLVGSGIGFGLVVLLNPRGRIVAEHEDAAIRQVRAIQEMETLYKSKHGEYATALGELQSVSDGFSDGKGTGYLYAVGARPGGYSVAATPQEMNVSGKRTFYSDESGVVRESSGAEAANAGSPEVK